MPAPPAQVSSPGLQTGGRGPGPSFTLVFGDSVSFCERLLGLMHQGVGSAQLFSVFSCPFHCFPAGWTWHLLCEGENQAY